MEKKEKDFEEKEDWRPKVKMIISDNHGLKREEEGVAVIFFMIQEGEDENVESRRAATGVFGAFSPMELLMAKAKLDEAMIECTTGKEAKKAGQAIEEVLKKIGGGGIEGILVGMVTKEEEKKEGESPWEKLK